MKLYGVCFSGIYELQPDDSWVQKVAVNNRWIYPLCKWNDMWVYIDGAKTTVWTQITVPGRFRTFGDAHIVFLNSDFTECTRVAAPNVGHAHQAVVDGDILLITNTAQDCICRYNMATNEWLDPIMVGDSSRDLLHVNSIFLDTDKIYVVCHRFGISTIMVYNRADWAFIEELADMGKCSHNVWKMGGELWFCDSFNKVIRNFAKTKVSPDLDTFTRGVALDGNTLYVGGSKGRANSTLLNSLGKLTVLDATTLAVDRVIQPPAGEDGFNELLLA